MAIIYGLVDSRNNNLFYIGITRGRLDYRLNIHLANTRHTKMEEPCSTLKKALINDIVNCGNKVMIIPIWQCNDDDGRETEQQAFALFTLLGFTLHQSTKRFGWRSKYTPTNLNQNKRIYPLIITTK